MAGGPWASKANLREIDRCANCVRASTGFRLRENADHSKIFAAPFRFTIGRHTYSGSVARLQIGFATGILMGGAREAQTERILSKRHPKRGINKGPGERHLMSTCRGIMSFLAVVILLTKCRTWSACSCGASTYKPSWITISIRLRR